MGCVDCYGEPGGKESLTQGMLLAVALDFRFLAVVFREGKGQHTLETMWAAPHREMEGEVVAGGRMAGWEGSLWEAVGVVGLFVTASAPQTSSTPFWQIFCPRGPFPPGTLASSRFGCRSACRRARQRSSIEKWAGGADPPVVILISHIGHRSSHWS